MSKKIQFELKASLITLLEAQALEGESLNQVAKRLVYHALGGDQLQNDTLSDVVDIPPSQVELLISRIQFLESQLERLPDLSLVDVLIEKTSFLINGGCVVKGQLMRDKAELKTDIQSLTSRFEKTTSETLKELKRVNKALKQLGVDAIAIPSSPKDDDVIDSPAAVKVYVETIDAFQGRWWNAEKDDPKAGEVWLYCTKNMQRPAIVDIGLSESYYLWKDRATRSSGNCTRQDLHIRLLPNPSKPSLDTLSDTLPDTPADTVNSPLSSNNLPDIIPDTLPDTVEEEHFPILEVIASINTDNTDQEEARQDKVYQVLTLERDVDDPRPWTKLNEDPFALCLISKGNDSMVKGEIQTWSNGKFSKDIADSNSYRDRRGIANIMRIQEQTYPRHSYFMCLINRNWLKSKAVSPTVHYVLDDELLGDVIIYCK